MRANLEHELRFIYWAKEAQYIRLSNEDYAAKIAWYKEHGTNMSEEQKTDRAAWISASLPYRLDECGKWHQLYTREKGKYYRYSTSEFSDDIVNPGRDAYNAVLNRLKEQYGNDRCLMRHSFGASDEEMKRCIPKQLYHVNERYTGRIINGGCSGIDFTSHYPRRIMGLLPNANGAQISNGRLDPTPEMPFAFYVKSGHLSIYNELDTRKWLSSIFAFRLFEHKSDWDWDLSVAPEDDVTVLMPAATVRLDDTIRYFFSRRKEDPTAKLVMNSFIGYLHQRDYGKYPYAHLAAVVLARANQAMLEVVEKIGFQWVIQICVDGAIYWGTKKYGGDGKEIGSIRQEFTDCVMRLDGTNRYIITKKDGTLVKYKMQGCNYIGNVPVPDNYVPKFEDMEKWNRKVELK